MIEQSPLSRVSPYTAATRESTADPITIAIADDHPVFRDGLARVLQAEEGFRVVGTAANGAEALDLVEQHHPEILLLDLFMPGVDGLATLQVLHTRRASTKVILLTASEERAHLVQAMQLGASGIVLKQDMTGVLVKSIRRVHAGEIWLNSSTTQAVMQRAEPAVPAVPFPPEAAALPVAWQPPENGARPSSLTRKEMEVVRLVAQGLRNKEIAARMFISEQTVKNHLRAVFEKLRVGDRLELALYAIHHLHEG
jgi:DNA-binding NarL/FixJ family response regulator